MFFEERVADLTRKMLRKKLYVVLSNGGGGAGQIAAVPAGASRIHDRPGKARACCSPPAR